MPPEILPADSISKLLDLNSRQLRLSPMIPRALKRVLLLLGTLLALGTTGRGKSRVLEADLVVTGCGYSSRAPPPRCWAR